MWVYLRAASLLVGMYLAECQWQPFDCRRPGSTCLNDRGQASVCQVTSQLDQDVSGCACGNDQYEGFDCGREKVFVNPAGCTLDCNRGVCYNDGSGFECKCNVTHYGMNCENKIVDVIECTDDSMTVNVRPHAGVFNGVVAVATLSGTPECVFESAVVGSGLEGYVLRLSLNTTIAGNPCASRLSQDGDGVYSYDIMVQYNDQYTSFTDEIHLVSCSHDSSVGLVGAAVNSVSLDEISLAGFTGAVEGQTSLDIPINLAITGRSTRTPVSGVIRVGDRLNLELTLDRSTPHNYVEFFVESCSAFNRDLAELSGPTLMEKPMVLDRCPDIRAMDVVESSLTKDGDTILIPIRGFKFDGFDSLHFFCSVKLCTAADKDTCKPIDCTNTGVATGFGRRRRQAGARAQDSRNVTRRVFVLTVGDDSVFVPGEATHLETSVRQESCLQSVAFISMAAIFGVLITVALIATIFVCMRMSMYQKRHSKEKMPNA